MLGAPIAQEGSTEQELVNAEMQIHLVFALSEMICSLVFRSSKQPLM